MSVTINSGGGVGWFWMYDNSEITIHDDGSVAYLYLYDNASASFYGCSSIAEFYIDPANTGFVKLYAEFEKFVPLSLYGASRVHGTWLETGDPFSITFVGDNSYSHVQFIPEPATLVLLGLGAFAMFKRQRR